MHLKWTDPARKTLIGMDSPLTGAPSMISYLRKRNNQQKIIEIDILNLKNFFMYVCTFL